MHADEIHRSKDKRGVDLISHALPFGRLCYNETDAIRSGLGRSGAAKFERAFSIPSPSKIVG